MSEPSVDNLNVNDAVAQAPQAPLLPQCPSCNQIIDDGQLVCPACGALVYGQQLHELVMAAQQAESTDPAAAVAIWRQCLPLLPVGSAQAMAVEEHIFRLTYMAAPTQGGVWQGGVQLPPPTGSAVQQAVATRPGFARRRHQPETVLSVLFKTGGSMLLSALVMYYLQHSWVWAIGFVVVLLIHELGHTLANWHYGLRQSPPIFLPYLGAVIVLLDMPRNAKVEAVIGISGPILGTVGALGAMVLAMATHSADIASVAQFAFFLNLFNLLPLPPLDGGRTAAAITPWLWVVGVIGIIGLALLMVLGAHQVPVVTLMIVWYLLSNAIPRIRATLRPGMTRHPYFRIGWVNRLSITLVYVGLVIFLAAMIRYGPGTFWS